MSILKKRPVALLIAAALVLASTLISVNVKFGAKCADVADSFYDGVEAARAYRQPGIGSHLNNLCTYADSVAIILDNYGADVEELSWDSEALKYALGYSREDIPYIYSCYEDLLSTLNAVRYQAQGYPLSERDAESVEDYLSRIDGAVNAIGESDYNGVVREFLRRYDHFPTDLLAEMAGVEMPEAFYYDR